MHHIQDVITLFNDCFFATYNTRLLKGQDEPLYLPANENQPYHALYFAHGFFSSALHEVAHWLIAGAARRQQVDFGYWYVSDGRNAEEQALFQQVEVKPQALEWILCLAAGHPFRVSIDNLNGSAADAEAFKRAIHQQVGRYCEQGLPARAATFRQVLCEFYRTAPALVFQPFDLQTLR